MIAREVTETLRLQWQASRWLVLLLVLVGVGLPQAVVRMATLMAQATDPMVAPAALVGTLAGLSRIFVFIAVLTGVGTALAAWHRDHRTGHVYALTLPVSRARYALTKLWAGAAILCVPVLAIWVGAWIAVTTVPIPDGLRAYPFAFGARFLLAALLCYATMFALASGTIRTTLIVTIAPVLLLVLVAIIAPVLQQQFAIDMIRPLQAISEAVAKWPGPFQVFTGDWLLIDV